MATRDKFAINIQVINKTMTHKNPTLVTLTNIQKYNEAAKGGVGDLSKLLQKQKNEH